MSGGSLRVHAISHGSVANGPGRRSVLHLQGCTIGCPGCFSKHTWDADGGTVMSVRQVADRLTAYAPDGISISGGEPLQQPEALLELLLELAIRRKELCPTTRVPAVPLPKGVIVYSGTTPAQRVRIAHWQAIQKCADLFVLGPYVVARSMGMVRNLRSSTNQELYFRPGGCLTPEDFKDMPSIEVLVSLEGTTIMGFPNKELLEDIDQ